MLVELVIGLGITLRCCLAQHGDRLVLALMGQVARHRDLELCIRGVGVERHFAAFVPQGPAPALGFLTDILLRLFKQPLA